RSTRGEREPLADERDLPAAERGGGEAIPRRGRGGRLHRPEGPPFGGRDPRLDLQCAPPGSRGDAGFPDGPLPALSAARRRRRTGSRRSGLSFFLSRVRRRSSSMEQVPCPTWW